MKTFSVLIDESEADELIRVLSMRVGELGREIPQYRQQKTWRPSERAMAIAVAQRELEALALIISRMQAARTIAGISKGKGGKK
jgi:hypothetical protein